MKFTKLIDDIHHIQQETDGIYIYGAGFYGKDVCRVLRNNDIDVQGFLVTRKADNAEEVLGLPVYEADDLLQKNIGIVIGLSDTYSGQVRDDLAKQGFAMNHVVNGGRYITDTGGREDLRQSKVSGWI